MFAGLITLHEWYARRRRICYAHGSLHTHAHKSRRSSFSSSSLPDLGFASVLTLHVSSSKEALGLSPAFSPAAVKAMSTHFLPFKSNILLGKVWVSDATTHTHSLSLAPFFSFFLPFSTFHQVNSDEWKSPPCARNLPRQPRPADSVRGHARSPARPKHPHLRGNRPAGLRLHCELPTELSTLATCAQQSCDQKLRLPPWSPKPAQVTANPQTSILTQSVTHLYLRTTAQFEARSPRKKREQWGFTFFYTPLTHGSPRQ